MTTFASMPPITSAYDQVDRSRWVNRNCGDTVQWDPAANLFQRYDSARSTWYWWGPGKSGTWHWHAYSTPRMRVGGFLVYLAMGFAVLLWAASEGNASAGGAAFAFFLVVGGLMTWLLNKHPLVHDVVVVAAAAAVVHDVYSSRHH